MRNYAELIVEALLDGKPGKVELPPDLPDFSEPEPLSPVLNTHDLALDYMEGEVGRHDWKRNWSDHRKRHGDKLREKVAAWLKHYEIDHDPQGIIDYIDGDLSSRDGKWL